MGLPTITVRNAWTLPQERYNAQWLLDNDLGLVLNSFKDIAGAVRTLLSGDTLTRMQASARRVDNRAIFEIPGILTQIFERHGLR